MAGAIIAGLFAILGTVIGIFSTHLIHYIDRKSEERKLVNESIHYLLEVYFQVHRINTGKMKRIYMDYTFQRIKKSVPEVDGKLFESIKEQLSPNINRALVAIAQQSFEELKSLDKQYEAMVAKLATILPINAYYMRGKNNLENLLRIISEYFESIKQLDIENIIAVNEFMGKMQLSLTLNLLNDYENDLKVELNELLKKTTCYNRRKGKEVIKKLESEVLTDDDKHKIDTLVDKMTREIMSNISQTERQ